MTVAGSPSGRPWCQFFFLGLPRNTRRESCLALPYQSHLSDAGHTKLSRDIKAKTKRYVEMPRFALPLPSTLPTLPSPSSASRRVMQAQDRPRRPILRPVAFRASRLTASLSSHGPSRPGLQRRPRDRPMAQGPAGPDGSASSRMEGFLCGTGHAAACSSYEASRRRRTPAGLRPSYSRP